MGKRDQYQSFTFLFERSESLYKKMKNNFSEISTVINSYMYMCVYNSTCVAECRSYRCPSSSPIRFTYEWVIHSLLLFSLFHSFHSLWFWDQNWPLNWRLIFLIWYRGFKLMIVGLLQKRRMMKMSKFENKTWQMPHFSTLSFDVFHTYRIFPAFFHPSLQWSKLIVATTQKTMTKNTVCMSFIDFVLVSHLKRMQILMH